MNKNELSLSDLLPVLTNRHEESIAERDFYGARQLPVRLSSNTLGLGRDLLSSSLFGVGRGERRRVDVRIVNFRGHAISYRGPQLRQDDARVLAFLVHAVRGKSVTSFVGFKPAEFVARLGWGHKHLTYSVNHLRSCLERLQEGVLKIEASGSALSAQLVGQFEERDDRWEVQLHASIVSTFEGGCTFLPLAERRELSDGLESWLAGFLRANSDENRFTFQDLLTHSGSLGDVKEFGRHVRETMPRIRSIGVVSAFSFTRGAMVVER